MNKKKKLTEKGTKEKKPTRKKERDREDSVVEALETWKPRKIREPMKFLAGIVFNLTHERSSMHRQSSLFLL